VLLGPRVLFFWHCHGHTHTPAANDVAALDGHNANDVAALDGHKLRLWWTVSSCVLLLVTHRSFRPLSWTLEFTTRYMSTIMFSNPRKSLDIHGI
jgi:hypothetical protein